MAVATAQALAMQGKAWLMPSLTHGKTKAKSNKWAVPPHVFAGVV